MADGSVNTEEGATTFKKPTDGACVVNNDDRTRSKAFKAASGGVHLKVLIPATPAALLLGVRGRAIRPLEIDHDVTINMNDDVYPGTTNRVCLIVGSLEGVRAAHSDIIDKMADPETRDSASDNRAVTVKILVPNSTVSMVIGKGGEYIRRMQETTAAYVQVSQKSKDRTLVERCITITGECGPVRAAVDLVLDKIVADPLSASCPNITYDSAAPLPNILPTGSPYAATGGAGTTGWPALGGGPPGALRGGLATRAYMQEMNMQASLKPCYLHTHNLPSNATLDQLQVALRAEGFSEQATGDLRAAMYTLVGYGLLHLRLLAWGDAGAAGQGWAGESQGVGGQSAGYAGGQGWAGESQGTGGQSAGYVGADFLAVFTGTESANTAIGTHQGTEGSYTGGVKRRMEGDGAAGGISANQKQGASGAGKRSKKDGGGANCGRTASVQSEKFREALVNGVQANNDSVEFSAVNQGFPYNGYPQDPSAAWWGNPAYAGGWNGGQVWPGYQEGWVGGATNPAGQAWPAGQQVWCADQAGVSLPVGQNNGNINVTNYTGTVGVTGGYEAAGNAQLTGCYGASSGSIAANSDPSWNCSSWTANGQSWTGQ